MTVSVLLGSLGGLLVFMTPLMLPGIGSGFIQYHATVTGIIHSESPFLNYFAINQESVAASLGFFPPILFPFVAGTPFSLSVFLQGIEDGAGGDQFTDGQGLHLSLDQISLFDADGHPITGYTLTSASGTEYSAVGAANVPETSSSLLLLTVLLGCVALGWKRPA